MPFEEKPLLPELDMANVGDKVVASGVKIVRELWRGGKSNTIVMYLTERDGCEGVVKVFDGKQLNPGEVITAVGKKADFNGKISIEVKAQEGGAVAFDGEPLPTGGTAVTLPRHQAAAGGQKSFLIFFYDRVLTKMKLKYTDEQNAASATHSVMIAYYRRDINEEELERWLSGPPEEEDIPF